MRKRKEGSTFVIVILIMAIIFTTGTAILTMTVNNYKIGINESRKLENLYKADSGLDTVENIIIKTSQEAIKYANEQVENEVINSNEYIEKDYIDNRFKEEFYNFLTLKVSDVSVKNITKSITNQDKSILEYLILNEQLIDTVSKKEDKLVFEFKDLSKQDEKYELEILDIENKSLKNDIKDIENIELNIKSTFESKDSEYKNQRKVSKTYIIKAPENSSDISTINIYPVFDEKAITADGNMNIENDNIQKSSINIKGNIWIKGNDDSINNNSSFIYNKYENGIKLKNSKLEIDGNIYSNNTITLTTNNEVTVNGSIYTRNVYVGKENYGGLSKNNVLDIENDVIVNNDLAINTSESNNLNNSNITIEGNFYGINDKTSDSESSNQEIINNSEDEKNIKRALQSSSIIKNDYDNSTLTIKKDAYILGVAYLDALDESGKRYQTGESIAVKGNYLAYTDIDVERVGKDITLKYYSPLQLIESINGINSIREKAEYFVDYYTSDNNKYKFNSGGISINGNIKSVGASFNNENSIVQAGTITSEDNNIILNKRKDFAINVFSMGDITGLSNTSSLYTDQKVEKTVSNQIDFSKLNTNIYNITENGALIVNNGDLRLVNGQVDNEQVNKGLVIVNGNVTMEGKTDFTGTIIATGNIIFEGTEEKNITYDGNLVRNIIAENYDILKDIFNSQSSKGKEIKINSSNEMYDPENFLKSYSWKIER